MNHQELQWKFRFLGMNFSHFSREVIAFFLLKTNLHNICHGFSEYLKYQEHSNNTRNKCSVCLPRLRTEYARKGFFYMDAKILMNFHLVQRCLTMYLPLGKL